MANRNDGEQLRVRIEDGEGHVVDVAVVGPRRRIRVEIAAGESTVLQGDADPWSFEGQLDLMRRHGLDAKTGIAGRLQVSAVETSDTGRYVDWGNRGSTIWLYPNRRGSGTDMSAL
jgi:hypothetical protein